MTFKPSYWGKPPIDFKNNNPASIGECSPEVGAASNWIIAIDAWDYCDPSLLGEMLSRHPVPAELRPIIADIITGKRKQNKRAAAKLKTPAGHRLIWAGIYAELKQGVFDAILAHRTTHDYHDKAGEMGIEPVELQSIYRDRVRKFDAEMAELLGVSVETLKNTYLELRNKIKNYPNI